MAKRVAVISDTHGYLSEELAHALRGADLIVHAGDICSASDFRTLSGMAPLKLCLGNNDWGYDYGPGVERHIHFLYEGALWQVCHYREKLNSVVGHNRCLRTYAQAHLRALEIGPSPHESRIPDLPKDPGGPDHGMDRDRGWQGARCPYPASRTRRQGRTPALLQAIRDKIISCSSTSPGG